MATRKATTKGAKQAATKAAKPASKNSTAAPGKSAAKGAAKPAKTAAKSPKPAAKSASGAKPAAKPQTYAGSCHCGRIAFTVTGAIESVIDCNCSMCRRRGGLLWFVPRDAFVLSTPESDLATYTFNKHVLRHHFCPSCGIAPFSDGEAKGQKMASVNVRCLDGVDLAKLKVVKYDGLSK